MEQYISRINKLGSNDPVNSEVVNTIFEQIQHNIDLLYSSYKNSIQNWNVSEMIYGNMCDYDQIGEKRFINGGRMDSVEKVLAFACTTGTISYEEFTTLNNSNWLRWDIDEGLIENIRLVRSITIPDYLRHQNILLAFKMVPFYGYSVKQKERYDIYVNGVFSGTAETGAHEINNNLEPKTMYATYQLTGSETSIEIELVRSATNVATPANYRVRISNVFVGLHALGNDSFALNYPTNGSSFIGAGADINAFFDFENNSIRPIPSFLINGDKLEGESASVVVNITEQAPAYQNTFYVGIVATGNKSGINKENLMKIDDFFEKTDLMGFANLYIQASEDYGDFVFNSGVYNIFIEEDVHSLKINSIVVDNGASVYFQIIPHDLGTTINIPSIYVRDNSYFKLFTKYTNYAKVINTRLICEEQSALIIEAGLFIQPLIGGTLYSGKNSNLNITINDSDYLNSDGTYGFGANVASLNANDYSTCKIENLNNGLSLHIGQGTVSESINMYKYSTCTINGFTEISTSSVSKTFKGELYSNIEISDTIQHDGGATAVTDIILSYYSTFGSKYNSGTFNETINNSIIYQI